MPFLRMAAYFKEDFSEVWVRGKWQYLFLLEHLYINLHTHFSLTEKVPINIKQNYRLLLPERRNTYTFPYFFQFKTLGIWHIKQIQRLLQVERRKQPGSGPQDMVVSSPGFLFASRSLDWELQNLEMPMAADKKRPQRKPALWNKRTRKGEAQRDRNLLDCSNPAKSNLSPTHVSKDLVGSLNLRPYQAITRHSNSPVQATLEKEK